MSQRLALGTVQFGLPYGVANRSGLVGPDAVRSIVNQAAAAGCDTLDTAIAYGASEQCLGEIGVGRWRVVSKLPPLPDSETDVDAWVQRSVLGSLQRLKVARLYGLLLHRSEQLLGSRGSALYRALVAVKERGHAEKIGVSIYDPAELDAIGPRFELGLVQTPFNIFDRRIALSGWLARLHDAGVEIHVRSIFLQGLLLMEPAIRPERFSGWAPLWRRWDDWLAAKELTPLEACVRFALSRSEVERVVVGVDSPQQLQQILASTGTASTMPPETLVSDDLNLINPSRWSTP